MACPLTQTQLDDLRAKLKTLLGIDGTESDETLDLLIEQAYEGLRTQLNRTLYACDFVEEHTVPFNTGVLTLNQPDVQTIEAIYTRFATGLRVNYSGSAFAARVQVTPTAVQLSTNDGTGLTTTVLDFATYPTLADLKAQIDLESDWSADLLTDGLSANLIRFGGRSATVNTNVALEQWTGTADEYEADYPAGTVTFIGLDVALRSWGYRDVNTIRVQYRAGFETLPADLEAGILNSAKVGYDKTKQTAGLKSERLGDYAYEVLADSNVITANVAAAAQQAAQVLWPKYGRMIP